MSYLLDSSAWLAHLFGEPGVEQINLLFDAGSPRSSLYDDSRTLLEAVATARQVSSTRHKVTSPVCFPEAKIDT